MDACLLSDSFSLTSPIYHAFLLGSVLADPWYNKFHLVIDSVATDCWGGTVITLLERITSVHDRLTISPCG